MFSHLFLCNLNLVTDYTSYGAHSHSRSPQEEAQTGTIYAKMFAASPEKTAAKL